MFSNKMEKSPKIWKAIRIKKKDEMNRCLDSKYRFEDLKEADFFECWKRTLHARYLTTGGAQI